MEIIRMKEIKDKSSYNSNNFGPAIGSDTGTVCVVGMGYVGLPLSIEFDREGFDVIGYDVDKDHIDKLDNGYDPTGDIGAETVYDSEVIFTAQEKALQQADYALVTVPTPVDDLGEPDLEYVKAAGAALGEQIQPGTTVVLESTVYPGVTRKVLQPRIEERSGLVGGEDFYVGYSPERMVPGDEDRSVRDIVKVVSGQNDAVLDEVATLYESVVDAGIHRASEIEVAEAAKCIENIQRDVNIALMNELAVAFHHLDLDTHEVLAAARTKWNFHDYRPGLVGGHCVPVDPFFMIYESCRNGFVPELIRQAREVNEQIPEHVAELAIRGLNACSKVLRESTILVLGLAYKPGVADIRSSPIDETIEILETYGIDVVGFDPHADDEAVRNEFGIEVQSKLSVADMDGILLATPHEEIRSLDFSDLVSEMCDRPVVIDLTGVLDEQLATDDRIEYKRL